MPCIGHAWVGVEWSHRRPKPPRLPQYGLTADVVSFNATMAACDQGHQWDPSLSGMEVRCGSTKEVLSTTRAASFEGKAKLINIHMVKHREFIRVPKSCDLI